MTEMTKSAETPTKMVAPKEVEIKILRDVSVGGKILKPGEICKVSPEMAKELCDKKFRGPLVGTGEHLEGNAKYHKIARAVRISTLEAEEKLRKLQESSADAG